MIIAKQQPFEDGIAISHRPDDMLQIRDLAKNRTARLFYLRDRKRDLVGCTYIGWMTTLLRFVWTHVCK